MKEEFKTLEGKNVSPVQFQTAREARDFIKQYEGVEGILRFMDTNDLYINTSDKSFLAKYYNINQR